MTTSAPVRDTVLYALAPTKLVSYRSTRFAGDSISVGLDEFTPDDQQRVKQLYATLLDLRGIFEAEQTTIDILLPSLRDFTQALNLYSFVQSMQQVGRTGVQHTTPAFQRVVHDLKGGSFTALAMTLQMLLIDHLTLDEIYRIAFLVRDHLAIMRNCVPDLDRAANQHSRSNQTHHISIIKQTWDGALYTLPQGAARVQLDAQFTGFISTSDTEFAALRRSIYNIINNAVRYTIDGNVYMSILGLPEQRAKDARFVVYNRVSDDHQRTLQQRYPHGLSELFRGGFSTGGAGIGMRICGEFIAQDYGVDIEQCIERSYVGATLRDDYFIAWFHWPTVTSDHTELRSKARGDDS